VADFLAPEERFVGALVFRFPVVAPFFARLSFAVGGTFPPARRASDNPIAMACFRLLTVLPLFPLFSVPCLRSCSAFFTFLVATAPYFAISLSS
jgi:hypothetical protein